jgi:hypothetical protein
MLLVIRVFDLTLLQVSSENVALKAELERKSASFAQALYLERQQRVMVEVHTACIPNSIGFV